MKAARDIYDNFIMKELLSHSHVSHLLSQNRQLYLFSICFARAGLLERVSATCPKTLNEE